MLEQGILVSVTDGSKVSFKTSFWFELQKGLTVLVESELAGGFIDPEVIVQETGRHFSRSTGPITFKCMSFKGFS